MIPFERISSAQSLPTVLFVQGPVSGMEEKAKPVNITHLIEARLAQLILASRPLAAWILVPILVLLAAIEQAGFPPLVFWSSKPRIFPDAREAKAIPVKVD